MSFESRREVRARLLDFDARCLEAERAARSEARGVLAQWSAENAEAKLSQGLDDVSTCICFINFCCALCYLC